LKENYYSDVSSVFSVVFPSFFSCFSFSSSCTFFERTYCRYPYVTCLTAPSFSKPAPIAPATVAADVTSQANFAYSINLNSCSSTSLTTSPGTTTITATENKINKEIKKEITDTLNVITVAALYINLNLFDL